MSRLAEMKDETRRVVRSSPMARIFSAFFCLAVAFAATAGDTPIVEAAKKAKEARKKSTTKVITNSDVKKASGKLIVRPESPAPAAEPKKDDKAPLEKADDLHRARVAAGEALAAAEKKVAELERELRTVEESYYAENDPSYRDDVIRKRFEQTKKLLEAARTDLTARREAMAKLSS
jgi:hypothetical protein